MTLDSRILAHGPVAGALVVWHHRSQRFVTAVVKATFRFDGSLAPEPEPIVAQDEHHDRNPMRSLRVAADTAPYLPGAEVVIRGSAVGPKNQETLARLAIARGSTPLLDRSFQVRTDGAGRVALIAENAFGGPAHPDNPVGRTEPLIADPKNPRKPILVGPIPRAWLARAGRLRPADRMVSQAAEPEIAEGFPWDWFHTAAPEQRLSGYLHGDEAILLKGIGGDGSQVLVRLPGVRAFARLIAAGQPPVDLPLVGDTLSIDADSRQLSFVSRATLAAPSTMTSVTMIGSVAFGGRAVDWPDPGAIRTRAPEKKAPATAFLRLEDLSKDTLPFVPTAAPQAPAPPASKLATPWSADRGRAAQPVAANQSVTASDALVVAPEPPPVVRAAPGAALPTPSAPSPPPREEPLQRAPQVVVYKGPEPPAFEAGSPEAIAHDMWRAGASREDARALLDKLRNLPDPS